MLAQESAGIAGLPNIPAMTTNAEREFYYRLVKENAHRGAVVELGAWLGASTAYIAAGMRDAGVEHKAQVYDRFVSDPSHAVKARAWYSNHGSGDIMVGPAFKQFKSNLGPLLAYVEPHRCEIDSIEWGDDPIAVLVTDAPKRVPQISSVLTTFREALPGAIMAWQDFCHFPSYEIPACLYRLADKLEFVEAVVPGTTMAFRVDGQWDEAEVSASRLALKRWTREKIDRAWTYWLRYVPTEKAPLFRCGQAMFLCDIGEMHWGVETLRHVFNDNASAILPKWRYLHQRRPDFVTRYAPLFDFLAREGALTLERAA